MARIIALDSGPVGLLTMSDRGHPRGRACRAWLTNLLFGDAQVILPASIRYEIRREMLRDHATARLRHLDALTAEGGIRLVPITNAALDVASSLWADVRKRGLPTADDADIDVDCILAGQALDYAGLNDRVTIATNNVRHLARFPGIDARDWETIA